jgi:hypothetical protein
MIMNKLSLSVKCVNCHHILESPVFLPCGDSICKKHTVNCQGPILCHSCEIEHPIPTNGGFPISKAIAGVIDAQIACLDFGTEHKESKESCEHFDELLTKIDEILKSPYNFTFEAIGYLKNVVQIKGEEMILKINEKMDRMISKLEEYKIECKNGFSKSEYVVKSDNFVEEIGAARKDLEKWLTILDEIKFNEKEWIRIKNESNKSIELFEKKLVEFKTDLFPKRFGEFRDEIEKDFGKFEIDPSFNLE